MTETRDSHTDIPWQIFLEGIISCEADKKVVHEQIHLRKIIRVSQNIRNYQIKMLRGQPLRMNILYIMKKARKWNLIILY